MKREAYVLVELAEYSDQGKVPVSICILCLQSSLQGQHNKLPYFLGFLEAPLTANGI